MLSLSAASFCRGDLVEVVDTYYTLRSDPKKNDIQIRNQHQIIHLKVLI